jgi:hypothetical protein
VGGNLHSDADEASVQHAVKDVEKAVMMMPEEA